MTQGEQPTVWNGLWDAKGSNFDDWLVERIGVGAGGVGLSGAVVDVEGATTSWPRTAVWSDPFRGRVMSQ